MTIRPLRIAARLAGPLLAAGLLGPTAGCTAVAFAATAMEEAKRNSKVDVQAEYEGLDGHSFAVLVVADRVTQAEHPAIVPRFTQAMNERLKEETEATGYVPPRDLLAYTYNNPRWVARPLGEVAADIGVDRLVLVEIQEYRLYEPGNRYVWDGVVLGTVGVIESESLAPDEFVYTKTIRVAYPDQDKHYSPEESNLNESIIATVLESRFVNRVTWLFYDHKELYSIEY